jgi:enoyl-CoA hydratase/carnithine racemase
MGEVSSDAKGAPGEARAPDSADIVVDRGRVSVVSFNRPDKRNAITLKMWRDLSAIVSSLESDNSVRAVVLTGDGCFSAGADISEFGQVRANAEQAAKYEGVVEDTLSRLHDCSKPTIAAVQGFCLGGGMALAQACDFRIADSTASFSVPAARLGIVYNERECQSLVSIVGVTNAKHILFSGERFNAAYAARIGFAELVHDGEALQNATHLGETLAANAPLSISGMKFIVNRLSEGRAEQSRPAIASKIHQALESRDYREAVAAFRDKRKVEFCGM